MLTIKIYFIYIIIIISRKYVYEESISIKKEINVEVQTKAKLVSLKQY